VILASLLADLAAQAGTVVQLDVGAIISRLFTFVGTGLLAIVIWFLRRLVTGFEALDQKVSTMNGEVKKVSQELFGPDGRNGMRSELKRASRSIHRHERVLIKLAERNDVNVPELEEDHE